MSFTTVYRVGVWFGFVRFALLLAVVLFWVDRCFDSWVLLGLFCLRVAQSHWHNFGFKIAIRSGKRGL